MKPPIKATLTVKEEKGTPAALSFLAERELAARQNIRELANIYDKEFALTKNATPEMDGIDFMARANSAKEALTKAEVAHQKQAQALREMDRVVDPSKRDAEEKISKADGIRAFSMGAIYINNALQTFGTRAITEIREARTEQEAWKKTGDILTESLINSFKVAIAEAHLPSWSLEAVESVL